MSEIKKETTLVSPAKCLNCEKLKSFLYEKLGEKLLKEWENELEQNKATQHTPHNDTKQHATLHNDTKQDDTLHNAELKMNGETICDETICGETICDDDLSYEEWCVKQRKKQRKSQQKREIVAQRKNIEHFYRPEQKTKVVVHNVTFLLKRNKTTVKATGSFFGFVSKRVFSQDEENLNLEAIVTVTLYPRKDFHFGNVKVGQSKKDLPICKENEQFVVKVPLKHLVPNSKYIVLSQRCKQNCEENCEKHSATKLKIN